MDTSDPIKARFNALKSKSSLIKNVECERKLRDFYNLPDIPLLYSKIDFDPNLDMSKPVNGKNGVTLSYKILRGDTKEVLDLSICKDIPAKANLPLNKENDAVLNKMYNFLKTSGRFLDGRELSAVDITNKADPLYNDRCIRFQNEKGQMLTINEKRKGFFPNFTISCNSTTTTSANNSCVYQGLDENNMAKCSCQGIQDSKNVLANAILDAIADINIYIIQCYLNVLVFVSKYMIKIISQMFCQIWVPISW